MNKKMIIAVTGLLLVVMIFSFGVYRFSEVPTTWDEKELNSMSLPNPDTAARIQPVTAAYYYNIPERVPYKTYPFYMPGKEPEGYYEWLRQQQPEIVFDTSRLTREADRVKAGEIIYDMPTTFQELNDAFMAQFAFLAKRMEEMHMPVTKEGIIPFMSIVIREKGKIELGSFSCGMCHTKVMPDGSLLKGGQGNFQTETFNAALAVAQMQAGFPPTQPGPPNVSLTRLLFTSPWVRHESQQRMQELSLPEWMNAFTNITPGINHRHGTVLGYPISIPDLFNLKNRKYLDHTGLVQQRTIADIMRYAALNQFADFLSSYNGLVPQPEPEDPKLAASSRYTDPQLYALATYLYSLKPPKNPGRFSKNLLTRGEIIFKEQGCVTCHTPPFYTNNKLTPVDGFEPPEEHLKKYSIFNVSVGTDPVLALYTRRGTGYYKVPSLIGAWNRTAFLHGGNLTNLEDLFDPKRLEPGYMPTGYKPPWLKTMPVTGHEYGLELNAADKQALLAFIKSL